MGHPFFPSPGRFSAGSQTLKTLTAAGMLLAAAASALEPAGSGEVDPRRPVPGEAAGLEAEALLREVYGQDLDDAKTAMQETSLARRLSKQAAKTNDPTERFVLLRKAQELYAEAGEVDFSLEAAELLSDDYALDRFEEIFGLLKRLSENVGTQRQEKELADSAEAWSEEALKRDRFAEAKELAAMALTAAKAAGDGPLSARLQGRGAEIDAIAQAHAEAQEAEKALARDPLDRAANLALGRYYCLWRDRWDKGLSMLALSGEPPWEQAAVDELKGPESADAQATLADVWWDRAEELEGVPRRHLRQHAVWWYRKALSKLSGLAESKAQKRIDEVTGSAVRSRPSRPKAPARRSGDDEPDNVRRYKAKKFFFNDLAGVRDDWDLEGNWRVDPQGIRLFYQAQMTSKHRFDGDFTIDITYMMTRRFDRPRATFYVFGQRLDSGLPGMQQVRLQRKGNTVTLISPARGRLAMAAVPPGLGDEPTSLGIQLRYERATPGGHIELLIPGMVVTGKVVP